jgi:hypothetical protein
MAENGSQRLYPAFAVGKDPMFAGWQTTPIGLSCQEFATVYEEFNDESHLTSCGADTQ